MINLPTTIKPLHIGIAVGAIVAAIIVTPFIVSTFNAAYPPIGSRERYMVDACASENPNFNRMSSSQLQTCIAFKQISGKY